VRELAANDPTTIMASFTAQWTAMLQALGTPMVAPAMEAMKGVTDIFTTIAQVAGKNPNATGIVEWNALRAAIVGLMPSVGALAVAATDAASAVSHLVDDIRKLVGVAGAIGKFFGDHSWKPESDTAPGPRSWMWHPSSVSPAPQGSSRPIVAATNISIDGRQLASAIDQLLGEHHEFPVQAAYSDHLSSYAGPDAPIQDT
jgi:hypothetical protein